MTIPVDGKDLTLIRAVLIETLAFISNKFHGELMLTVATDHHSQEVKFIAERVRKALETVRQVGSRTENENQVSNRF